MRDTASDPEYRKWVELTRRADVLYGVSPANSRLSFGEALIAVCLHDIAEAFQPGVVTELAAEPQEESAWEVWSCGICNFTIDVRPGAIAMICHVCLGHMARVE